MSPIFRSRSKRPSYRTVPEDAVIHEGEITDSRGIVCPRCRQAGGIFYAGTIYEPGTAYHVYRCNNQSFGGRWCDQRIYARVPAPDVIWVSDNGLWSISREDSGDTVTLHIVSDEGGANTASMSHDGRIWWDHDNCPGYVADAVNRILGDIRSERGLTQDSEWYRVVADIKDANGRLVAVTESEDIMYFEDARRLQTEEWAHIPDVYKGNSAVRVVRYYRTARPDMPVTSSVYNILDITTARGRR